MTRLPLTDSVRTNNAYIERLHATLRHDGFLLRKINKRDWTEELLLAAVKNAGRALQLIPEPSAAVVLAAVEQDGDALQYVLEQTDEICAAACRQWLGAFHHIVDEEMRDRVASSMVDEGVLATHPFADAANASNYRP